MAHTNKSSIFSRFPVFAPMRSFPDPTKSEDECPPDWLMCLWRDDTSKDEFCEIPLVDFMSGIGHLEDHHGISLQRNKDYCSDCRIIFHSPAQAVNHYLEKTLFFEDFSVKLLDSEESKLDLAPIFEQIKEMRKVLLDQMLFPEDMPELESEDLLIKDLEAIEGEDIPDSYGMANLDSGEDVAEYSGPRETQV